MKDLLKIYRMVCQIKQSIIAARYIMCNISYFNIELRIIIKFCSHINTIRPITYMEVVISEGGLIFLKRTLIHVGPKYLLWTRHSVHPYELSQTPYID